MAQRGPRYRTPQEAAHRERIAAKGRKKSREVERNKPSQAHLLEGAGPEHTGRGTGTKPSLSQSERKARLAPVEVRRAVRRAKPGPGGTLVAANERDVRLLKDFTRKQDRVSERAGEALLAHDRLRQHEADFADNGGRSLGGWLGAGGAKASAEGAGSLLKFLDETKIPLHKLPHKSGYDALPGGGYDPSLLDVASVAPVGRAARVGAGIGARVAGSIGDRVAASKIALAVGREETGLGTRKLLQQGAANAAKRRARAAVGTANRRIRYLTSPRTAKTALLEGDAMERAARVGRSIKGVPRKVTKVSLGANFAPAVAGQENFSDTLHGDSRFLRKVQEPTKGGVGAIGANLVKDVLGLPAATIPAVFMTGDAILQGIKSGGKDWSHLEQLFDAWKQTDAFGGVLDGISFHEFLARVGNHPGYTALELAGGYHAAGKTVGAAGRAGMLGADTQRRYLRTTRTDIPSVSGAEGAEYSRVYSDNPMTAKLQLRTDLRHDAIVKKRARGERLTTREQVGSLIYQAKGRKARLFTRDYAAGRSSQKAAADQSPLAKVIIKAEKSVGNDLIPAVLMVGERVIRPEEGLADVAKVIELYDEAAAVRGPGELVGNKLLYNRERVAALHRLQEGGQELLDKVVATARTLIDDQRPRERGMILRGIIDQRRAENARAIPERELHGTRGPVAPKDEAGVAPGDPADHEVWDDGQIVGEHKYSPPEDGATDTLFLSEQHNRSAGRVIGGHERVGGVSHAGAQAPKIGDTARTGRTAREGSSPADSAQIASSNRYMMTVSQAFDDAAEFDTTAVYKPNGGEGLDSQRAVEDFIAGDSAEAQALRERAMTDRAGSGLVAVRLNMKDEFMQLRQDLEEGRFDMNALTLVTNGIWDNMTKPLRTADGQLQPGQRWGIARADELKRAVEHHKPIDGFDAIMEPINRTFKAAVLPWSPNWYLGNFFDISMRAFLGGQLPPGLDRFTPGYKTGKHVMEAGGDDLLGLQHGLGGAQMYGHERPLATETAWWGRQDRKLRAEGEGTYKALRKFRDAPGSHHLLDLISQANSLLFHFNGAWIETSPGVARVGRLVRRELREQNILMGRARKDMDAGMADFIKGLRNTPRQAAFARQVHDLFGNWIAMSPKARSTMNTVVPFWTWARAASRFVFLSMPTKHPTVQGLLAAQASMTEQERWALGLTFNFSKPEGTLPDYRQGGAALGNGRLLPLARVNSYGVFGGVPSGFLQFLSGPIAIPIESYLGVDFKGDKVVDGDGNEYSEKDRAGLLLLGAGEAILPAAATADKLLFSKGRVRSGWNYVTDKPAFKTNLLHTLVPPSKIVSDESRKKAISMAHGKKKKKSSGAPAGGGFTGGGSSSGAGFGGGAGTGGF